MATAADLAAAREKLGDAVGLKPFKDYVRQEYGEVAVSYTHLTLPTKA